MRKTIFFISAATAALLSLALAQGPGIGVPLTGGLDLSDATLARPTRRGTTLPAACVVGEYFFKEDAAAGRNTYACTATDTWTLQGDGDTGGSGSLPAGAIVMIASGTCPSGFVEETSLSARMPLGTLAANSDVGTTGGADDITPAGTVSQPAFTGSALPSHTHDYSDVINHTHSVTVNDPGHTHVQSVNSNTTGGTSGYTPDTSTNTGAASGYSTQSATTGITASTTNPSGGVATGTTTGPSSTLTPAGTVSQPTFTGTQFDNRSAFLRVIFCRKT
jgi:hypothetical protein